MVRRKKETLPPFGIPQAITLLATRDGWRHSILTAEGGMLCGGLDVPIRTTPQDARAAATSMVKGLARDFHGIDIEVNWDTPQEPGAWNARIARATGSESASPDLRD